MSMCATTIIQERDASALYCMVVFRARVQAAKTYHYESMISCQTDLTSFEAVEQNLQLACFPCNYFE